MKDETKKIVNGAEVAVVFLNLALLIVKLVKTVQED